MGYNDVVGASITTVSTVPEPSTFALAAVGLAGGIFLRRRKA
jgi:hypothetical protein